MTHRAREIQKLEPIRIQAWCEIAVERSDSGLPVSVNSIGVKDVRRIVNGEQMTAAAGVFPVAHRLLVGPDAFCPTGMIAVTVILMYRRYQRRNIDYRGALHTRFPNKPVVPPDTAND